MRARWRRHAKAVRPQSSAGRRRERPVRSLDEGAAADRGVPQAGAGSPLGSVSFRLGAFQLGLAVFFGFLTATAVVHCGLAFTEQPPTRGELAQCLSGAVVAGPAVVLLNRRYGVTLTESDLFLQGDHRQRVPWADVQRIEVAGVLGVRSVAVHTKSGRRKILRAPISLFDRKFDEKVAVVLDHWQRAM
ncbi:hypothetical protein [Streptomyces sp. NPDC056660]|uniref:hypothetical protein n=1 Tax=Streptomyces sp. NPDC056660 TaxID=3345897 RepID=UPI0036C3A9EB